MKETHLVGDGAGDCLACVGELNPFEALQPTAEHVLF